MTVEFFLPSYKPLIKSSGRRATDYPPPRLLPCVLTSPFVIATGYQVHDNNFDDFKLAKWLSHGGPGPELWHLKFMNIADHPNKITVERMFSSINEPVPAPILELYSFRFQLAFILGLASAHDRVKEGIANWKLFSKTFHSQARQV